MRDAAMPPEPMNKPTERAPMLTRYSLYLDEPDTFVDMEHGEYVKWEDVQAKITSGELRVVKKVKCRNIGKDEAWCEWLKCPCGETTPLGSNFCPGCGAQIVKA